MATYKKQLLDKDGNVIYPDVGLNLDDVVYSDDPTEPVGDVSPWIDSEDIVDDAVTADKIDFSSFPHIVACGSHTFTNISGNSGDTYQVTIPTQSDTDYYVMTSHQAPSQLYSYVLPAISNKTSTSFTLNVWNNNSDTATATIGWIVVRNN